VNQAPLGNPAGPWRNVYEKLARGGLRAAFFFVDVRCGPRRASPLGRGPNAHPGGPRQLRNVACAIVAT
jgi:hypothetical protein